MFSKRKTANDCCYCMTSSNVNTIKEMCSRRYRSQFNKFEKAWARVEILCLNFRKTPSNFKIQNWAKWQPSKFVWFFLTTISHTYRTTKPLWRVAIKNDYQFSDALKAKDRKIRGNCNSLIKVKFLELEWSSPLKREIWH